MAKWTIEQKQKALAIAEASTLREAAENTGIPRGTIGRWMAETKQGNETSETKRASQKITQIAQEATEEAKAEVKVYVADKAKQVADDILNMVQRAIIEAGNVIEAGPNFDEPKASWLRAVIGAIAQGAEKHQLLSGQPTSRQSLQGQVTQTQRYEYDITQRIVSDPDAREAARDLFRRAVNPDMGGRRTE